MELELEICSWCLGEGKEYNPIENAVTTCQVCKGTGQVKVPPQTEEE